MFSSLYMISFNNRDKSFSSWGFNSSLCVSIWCSASLSLISFISPINRDEDASQPLSAPGEWADLCLRRDVSGAHGHAHTHHHQSPRPADFISRWISSSYSTVSSLKSGSSLSFHPVNTLLSLLLLCPMQGRAGPTRSARCVTCSWPPTLRRSCTTTAALTSAEWGSCRPERRDSMWQVRRRRCRSSEKRWGSS